MATNRAVFGRRPRVAKCNQSGRNRQIQETLEKRAIILRMSEKIANYERAAARLRLRGEHDAALALTAAAGRLRRIQVNPPGKQAAKHVA